MTPERPVDPAKSTAALISDVVAGALQLVKGELALAKAEASESLRLGVNAAVFLVVAAVLGIAAINMLAGAAVAGLVMLGWNGLASTLTVAVVLVVLTGGLAIYALSLLRAAKLLPERALRGAVKDAHTFKNMVRSDANV